MLAPSRAGQYCSGNIVPVMPPAFTRAFSLKYICVADAAGVREAEKPNNWFSRSDTEETTVPRVTAPPSSPIRCTTIWFPHVISSLIHEENMTGRITAVTIVLILLLNFIILFLFQLKNIRPKASQIHIHPSTLIVIIWIPIFPTRAVIWYTLFLRISVKGCAVGVPELSTFVIVSITFPAIPVTSGGPFRTFTMLTASRSEESDLKIRSAT